jgi:hypothetical protein
LSYSNLPLLGVSFTTLSFLLLALTGSLLRLALLAIDRSRNSISRSLFLLFRLGLGLLVDVLDGGLDGSFGVRSLFVVRVVGAGGGEVD